MMISILRTDSKNQDFINLVKDLDFYLALKDGEEHHFYSQFNSISELKHCVVFYKDKTPAACGAIKPYSENTMEVKRMFVKNEFRNNGFASQVLTELEKWAQELGAHSTILETGKRQAEAVALYSKTYEVIPNYGQYKGVEDSICFQKKFKI